MNAAILDPRGIPRRAHLAIEGGHIRDVAVDAPPDPPSPIGDLPRDDLDGRLLIPGFTDAHCHLMFVGLRLLRPDLAPARTRADALERLRQGVTDSPYESVLAEGWDESTWPDDDGPLTGSDLDSLGVDRPVVARRSCTHVAVANRAAIAALGGEPGADAGMLREEAAMGVGQRLPGRSAERGDAARLAAAEARRAGVTEVHEFGKRVDVRAWGQTPLDLTLRFFPRFEEWVADPHRFEDDVQRVTGHPVAGIKFFTDGSFGARTAAVRLPYADGPPGELLWNDSELADAVRHVHAAGHRAALHAIGDRAVTQCLDVFEEVGAAGDRIEHVELIAPEDIDRMQRLGVTASMQPNFIRRWGQSGGLYDACLGVERARTANPYGSLRRAGVPVAFGSDAMPFGPLWGLAGAWDHPSPGERLSAAEALAAATIGGPASLGQPGGRIERGAPADLVVLSERDLSRPSLARMRVERTYHRGRLVHGAGST